MNKNNYMNRKIFLLLFVACCGASWLTSCNRDDDITSFNPQPPTLEFDSENSIYKTKVNREVTIAPVYGNAEGAIYTWTLDGKIVSTDPVFSYTFTADGEYFITASVTTQYGSSSDEAKVEVSNLAPPVISLVVPTEGLEVIAGREYLLSPDVQNADNSTFRWSVNGKDVGTEKDYMFCERELGIYEVSLYAENEDGSDTKTFLINAVTRIPVKLKIPAPMYKLYDEEIVKYVSLGRSIYLRPYLTDGIDPTFQWQLDGINIAGATSQMLVFTPDAEGEYLLTVVVSDIDESADAQTEQITRNISRSKRYDTTMNIKVVCTKREGTFYNPADGFSSADDAIVHEFVAAPGQFVNEHYSATTMDEAIAVAADALNKGTYVSLGGFGGYIIVSLDHSIDNIEEQYNFSICGNQFDGSSEPGIVWVSQDTNGNGLPDDEWYELKHSEYGLDCTRQFYAVTYYRPEGARMDTQWKDNEGSSGCVDYLEQFHKQAYYYPNWIKENSYTLYGTCLEARNYQDDDLAAENGSPEYWVNPSYGWGYVDNMGSDMINGTVWTGFKISNAVNMDGTPANLKYIDFIKVVNGLNTKSGWLGEVSTEVFGYNDENINPKSAKQ